MDRATTNGVAPAVGGWGVTKYLATICLCACILITACGSPAPLAPTPIPAYVAGEEDLAYSAFSQYYDENCWLKLNLIDGSTFYTSIDLSQQGRAVYVGDGIWRFRIILKNTYSDADGEGTLDPEEEVITTRSLPDGGWENPCPLAGEHNESDRYSPPDEEWEEPPDEEPLFDRE